MINTTCKHSDESMILIDKFDRFLEPDERKNFINKQKVNGLVSRMSGILTATTVNVEIYKCRECGTYRGVEYI